MLTTIYSRDCPCLSSDGNAIDELLSEKRIWDGVRGPRLVTLPGVSG
jgi:hypothetical protein